MKIKGVKKAVGDYRAIMSKGNHPRIMVDTETGDVWCDEFASCTSWIPYVERVAEIRPYPVNMEYVRAAAEREIAEAKGGENNG